ncbi:hypothetical protein EV421DRAFT_1906441 [Armillaria borealis]|uniref:Uncharacterized protein n=1 Tax=Armillaria borealis TaxID=47425 RepID=A0AA39JB96_9AGAR|nr:hypothetical protein EV421DRAFT_1906441 [Armillaria borealis]
MLKPSHSKPGNKNKSKKEEGKVKMTELWVEGEEVEATPRIDLTSRQPKVPMEAKKPHLTFTVQPAADSKNIYNGKVVDIDGEADGEYSINDPKKETALYDLDALLAASCQPLVDHNQTEEEMDILPKPEAPVTSDSLFVSENPPPSPAHLVTVADDNSSSDNKDIDDNLEDDAEVEGTVPKEITEKMVYQDAALARAVLDKFLGDGTKMREAMREQLTGMAYSQRVVLRELAHAQTAKVFEQLGFNNIDKSSNEYIRQYNTEMLTALLGCDIRKSEETNFKQGSNSKESDQVVTEGCMFLTFAEQCNMIENWMKKGKTNPTEELVDKDILLTCKPKLVPGGPKKKPQPEPQPVKAKAELNPDTNAKGDSRQRTPTDIWELKNRVTLQRIQLSQIRNGLQPTVQDQGIVFDENNNAWLCPEPAEEKEEGQENPKWRSKEEKMPPQ